MPTDYLKKILTAKVYDVAIESPLEVAQNLSKRMNNTVYLKREDYQPVFSFKIRGAYNKMANLAPEILKKGVIAASAGNHAQGVALSARKLGCKALIVMPTSSPQVKIEAVERLGGKVILAGDSYSDAYEHALSLEKEEQLTFVHPFDDPDVIAGQGTVAMEILHQHSGQIDAVFVPIGGGGLAAGMAVFIKFLRPEIKVIGVHTHDSDAMIRSVKAGRRIALSDVGLFSDGTAVKQVGKENLKLIKQYVDDFVTVDTDAICAAVKDVFQDTRSILEPAGALALAGAKKYLQEKKWENKTVIAITSGANMNFDRLRFVSDRADVGLTKEALFILTINEEPGSFKNLCKVIGHRNVTEFKYRMQDQHKAKVLVGLQTKNGEEIQALTELFNKKKIQALNLSHNDLAKTHLRHMIGSGEKAPNELLFSFEFPERPSALAKFLDHMAPEWNISLFHYRNQGGDFGRVLIGIQVGQKDKKSLKEFLDNIGYRYTEETDNEAYKILA